MRTQAAGSKPRTSAPRWTLNRPVSKDSTGVKPLRPASSPDHSSSAPVPTGVTAPRPVTDHASSHPSTAWVFRASSPSRSWTRATIAGRLSISL